MIYYKHDDPNFTLTAYIEGEEEPIAWIDEMSNCWKLYGFIKVHTYKTFAELHEELISYDK